MINLKKILLSSALSLALALGFCGVKAYAAANVTRIDGGSGGRIGTADQLAKQQFGSADTVILVNGYGYADAVSATPLAKQLKAPILLTQGGSQLESEVMDTIKSLDANTVYIVGGNGVVPDSIKEELDNDNYTVVRIAGTTDTTRMGTNAAVAQKVLSLSHQSTGILVNGKDGYADALSAAAPAALRGYPVLFASKTEVSPVVKDAASGLTIKAVGGDAVLPQAVVSSVSGTKIPGNADNRYETNLSVLDYFKNNGGLDFGNVYIAFGGANSSQFADALVASAAAAKDGHPLLLSDSTVSEATEEARNYLLSINNSPNITIVGGTSSISSAVEDYFKNDDPFDVIGID